MEIMKFNYFIEILLFFFTIISHLSPLRLLSLVRVAQFLLPSLLPPNVITMAAMYEIIQEWKSACSVPETGSTANY